MGSNFLISCLHLIIIPTVISASFVDDDDHTGDHYIAQVCDPTSDPIIPGSQYAANLNNLVNDLVANTSLNNGFMSSSKGNGSENAHGHALCRHDVSSDGCKNCLAKVSATIRCSSPVAAIWHDYCLLTYSNESDKSYAHSSSYHITSESTEHDDTFRDTTLGLFYKLVGGVAIQEETMFASGNATYGNGTVHAMVQCTRDQPIEDCTTYFIINMVPELKACLPKKGGRIYSIGCVARYETFPFLLN